MTANYLPIVITVLVVLAIIFFSTYFSKKATIKRKLKNAPVKKISHFSSGETAKIIGKVELTDQPLYSPLSNRKCAYYYVHVQQKVSSGKSSHWKTIIEEEVSGNFLVRDGNAYAYIKTENIKSYIVQDQSFSSGFLKDASETLERYLQKHGRKSENFFGFNKKLRYKEGILEAGEEIAVLGKGVWKEAIEFNLPATYNRILVIGPSENAPVYLSDDTDTVNKREAF